MTSLTCLCAIEALIFICDCILGFDIILFVLGAFNPKGCSVFFKLHKC